MLPESLKTKTDKFVRNEMDKKIIKFPIFDENVKCCKCDKKAEFSVLENSSNIFKPMCSTDANAYETVRYCETIETYHKRAEHNFFKGWRLISAKC